MQIGTLFALDLDFDRYKVHVGVGQRMHAGLNQLF